jgi:predicted ATPase
MIIERVSLRNIKCFADEVFPLSKLNVLTGVNGVGKSTLIQSILLAAQTPALSKLEFNGSLVEIGDYSDLHHFNALDDSSCISIHSANSDFCWGFEAGTKFDQQKYPTFLPQMGGEQNGKDWLGSNFVYLSAERWGPRDNVPLNTQHTNPYWLGKHGEFTIAFLNTLANSSLRDDDGKSLATTSDDDPRIHSDDIGVVMMSNIIAWMGEISPNVNINTDVIREAAIGYSTFDFGAGNKFRAINVGFGLSYALSIVTALVSAREGSVVLLENPEAHLHPSGQSKLGQLLALTAAAGVQVIVETHSEHIINGARIKVRKAEVQPELVRIMYISRDDEKSASTVEMLDLDKMGHISNWPSGFFDQQAIDMKTLITGK